MSKETIICNECGKEVQRTINKCPNCGNNIHIQIMVEEKGKDNERLSNKEKKKCFICGREFYGTADERKCPNCTEELDSLFNGFKGKNTIAIIFKIIAWTILFIGFIGGIILSDKYGYDGTQAMITTWICCGLSFMFFFALGEIIQILHDIRTKLYSK